MNETFKATVDGQEVEFKVRRPTGPEQRESDKVYRRVFRESLENGDFVRAKLDDKLRDQGLWDDKKQSEHDLIIHTMAEGRKKLLKGGLKLSEARKIALDVIDSRNDLLKLLINRNQLDSLTAEAQAENAKFNYLVSVCVVYNITNKPYFRNLDDYIEKSENEIAIKGATALISLLNDIDSNEEANSVEHKFLKNWKFVDDKGRLVDKEGRLIDRDNKLIDESGRYIDEDGNRVDIDGNPVDDSGNWKFEQQPFLDEDNNPIIVETTKEEIPVETKEVSGEPQQVSS